ncbi:uncharacterized protein MONBRDRAFT_38157 [Monosiga brevicollis MX1]|uniref:Wings apart-like protein C-terminal domain-containing protein n=1 Tax=Monosiga brevicollis TaxID=81824 RepID=A9V602_MONBE|nr:uncharacterized protein MONBRDRAFT_38157 [Monosiga brevicollis MX1]EDQ86986.1 predicted protein [Monosiga brevicollis MX1]|eukprot:XP_001748225.1 hypothetical protein [Monosiga brevicollis MX1]
MATTVRGFGGKISRRAKVPGGSEQLGSPSTRSTADDAFTAAVKRAELTPKRAKTSPTVRSWSNSATRSSAPSQPTRVLSAAESPSPQNASPRASARTASPPMPASPQSQPNPRQLRRLRSAPASAPTASATAQPQPSRAVGRADTTAPLVTALLRRNRPVRRDTPTTPSHDQPVQRILSSSSSSSSSPSQTQPSPDQGQRQNHSQKHDQNHNGRLAHNSRASARLSRPQLKSPPPTTTTTALARSQSVSTTPAQAHVPPGPQRSASSPVRPRLLRLRSDPRSPSQPSRAGREPTRSKTPPPQASDPPESEQDTQPLNDPDSLDADTEPSAAELELALPRLYKAQTSPARIGLRPSPSTSQPSWPNTKPDDPRPEPRRSVSDFVTIARTTEAHASLEQGQQQEKTCVDRPYFGLFEELARVVDLGLERIAHQQSAFPAFAFDAICTCLRILISATNHQPDLNARLGTLTWPKRCCEVVLLRRHLKCTSLTDSQKFDLTVMSMSLLANVMEHNLDNRLLIGSYRWREGAKEQSFISGLVDIFRAHQRVDETAMLENDAEADTSDNILSAYVAVALGSLCMQAPDNERELVERAGLDDVRDIAMHLREFLLFQQTATGTADRSTVDAIAAIIDNLEAMVERAETRAKAQTESQEPA